MQYAPIEPSMCCTVTRWGMPPASLAAAATVTGGTTAPAAHGKAVRRAGRRGELAELEEAAGLTCRGAAAALGPAAPVASAQLPAAVQ